MDRASMSSPVDMDVVVPAHNAEATLAVCLDALLNAGALQERIVVVDDGSTDATGDIARRHGVRIVRNETALRPARARNRGVEEVGGDIVLFVDADVVLARDALARIARHFEDPSATAVIGSYDAAVPDRPRVSRYRNLLHHYVHQKSPGQAETFWTGIGAVRRDMFLAAGGFDPDWESIEDVEFGLRLRKCGGHIRLDPAIRGMHLKIWTLMSFLRTDFRGRAIPWARLIREGRIKAGTLNTARSHRMSALSVLAVVGGLAFLPVWPLAAPMAVAGAGAFVALNAGFFGFVGRTGGASLLAVAIPCHAAHYLSALAGYIVGRYAPDVGRARRRAARAS